MGRLVHGAPESVPDFSAPVKPHEARAERGTPVDSSRADRATGFSLDLAPADVVTDPFTKAATGEIVVTIHQ
jgi:hypothetical protein